MQHGSFIAVASLTWACSHWLTALPAPSANIGAAAAAEPRRLSPPRQIASMGDPETDFDAMLLEAEDGDGCSAGGEGFTC